MHHISTRLILLVTLTVLFGLGCQRAKVADAPSQEVTSSNAYTDEIDEVDEVDEDPVAQNLEDDPALDEPALDSEEALGAPPMPGEEAEEEYAEEEEDGEEGEEYEDEEAEVE